MPSWLLPVVVALLTALAFGNAAPDLFIFDDGEFLPIPRPAGETLAHTATRLFREDAWPARREATSPYRPLAWLSFVADDIAHPGDRAAYHRTSIALHVGATLLVYALALALLRHRAKSGAAPRHRLAAAGAALLFGVHPVHTDAVDSVFNRSEVLATAAVLGALALFVTGFERRPRRTVVTCALLYLAGLFCKESAATLPALLALAGAFLLRDVAPRERARRLLPLLWLLAPLAIYLAARGAMRSAGAPSVAAVGTFADAVALALTAFRDSAALLVWPSPLRAVRTDYVAEAVPVAVLFAAGYGAALWKLRARAAGVALGLALFAVALAPTTRIFTRLAGAQPMAERYVYLPSAGAAVAVAFGLAWALRRFGSGRPAVAVAAVAALFAMQTRARNEVWHAELALFRAEVDARPDNADALRLFSATWLAGGHAAELVTYCRARVADPLPGAGGFFVTCGLAAQGLGREDDAELFHRRANEVGATAITRYTYARVLARRRRLDDAAEQYRLAVAAERDPVRQHWLRAEEILKCEPARLDEALVEIDAALRIDPAFQIAQDLRRRIVAALAARDAPAAP